MAPFLDHPERRPPLVTGASSGIGAATALTVCEEEAPEVFEVPKKGQVHVLMKEPPTQLHEAVRQAVRYWPTGAIRLEDV